jgi:hypothetical protein
MASQAPLLGHQDIKAELDRIIARRRGPLLVALYGRGQKRSVLAQGVMFEVTPTRSELELRSLMPDPTEELHDGRVFLVDWTPEQLPLDLACRFAEGRMYRVTSETRLASLFGARSVDQSLLRTALAQVLLADHELDLGKIPGQVLQPPDAYRRFLAARVDLPLKGGLSVERLLTWAVTSDAGPGFAGQEGKTWKQLREEVAGFIEAEAPPGGALASAVWSAWVYGEGRRCLELALILEALVPVLGHGSYAEGVLKGALPTVAAGWGETLLAAGAAFADETILDGVLADLEQTAPETVRQVIESASELIEDRRFEQALARSPRLPLGWEERKRRLAETLEGVVQDPRPARLDEALQAHEDLQRHRHHHAEGEKVRDIQRQMAVRLVAYLVHRASASSQKAPGAEYQEALDLAETYAREGGFVDWARQRLRAGSEGILGQAYRRILSRVDDLRREDDKRFAEGLVAWHRAGQPSSQVLPLADCSKRLVAELLAESKDRKLLVVLLDGMSWANAVELAGSLLDEESRWSPACWKPKGVEGRSATNLPPVLASLPTITSVSRAAFFAGKSQKTFGDEPTAKDRARWNKNRAIQKLLGDGEENVLLLKDDLSREKKVFQAVSSDAPLVAMVLNAIDDQLQGSEQLWVECTAGHIKPLSEILSAAVSANRAVLLISDHGHVPGDVLVSQGKRGDGGGRWRPLGPDESPKDFEVALTDRASWSPRGSSGVALVWDETVCYGTPRYGEHGGASLAEVVAPALLMAPETFSMPGYKALDEGLRTVPLAEPSWWQLRMPDAPRKTKPLAVKKTAVQLDLLEPAPTTAKPAKAEPKDELPELVQSLQRSKVFREHTKGMPKPKVEAALEHLAVLVEAGGQLGVQDFARACSVQYFQVGGVVARLGEVFNVDGYPVIEHDRLGQQVKVNLSMLEQQFEVKR